MLENFGMPASMGVLRSELGNSMPMHNDFGMPASMGVFRDSLRPIEPYVDPGRTKFLEQQKMEWEYKPPQIINHDVKSDFSWFKPTTPIKPIIPKPVFSLIERTPEPIKSWVPEPLKAWIPEPIKFPEPVKIFEFKPVKPIETLIYENPYLKKLSSDFAFQPIKVETDIFPKRGGMHDSFNVTPSGDIFGGHTTIDIRGTSNKVRLPWETDLSQKTNLFEKHRLQF